MPWLNCGISSSVHANWMWKHLTTLHRILQYRKIQLVYLRDKSWKCEWANDQFWGYCFTNVVWVQAYPFSKVRNSSKIDKGDLIPWQHLLKKRREWLWTAILLQVPGQNGWQLWGRFASHSIQIRYYRPGNDGIVIRAKLKLGHVGMCTKDTPCDNQYY